MRTIAAYGLTLAAFMLAELLFLPIAIAFAALLKKRRSLFLIGAGLCPAAKMLTAVCLSALVCRLLGTGPALLMLIIPAVFSFRNGFRRIGRARSTMSQAEVSTDEQTGAPPHAATQNLRREWAHLIGTLIGLLVGITWCFGSAPLV